MIEFLFETSKLRITKHETRYTRTFRQQQKRNIITNNKLNNSKINQIKHTSFKYNT